MNESINWQRLKILILVTYSLYQSTNMGKHSTGNCNLFVECSVHQTDVIASTRKVDELYLNMDTAVILPPMRHFRDVYAFAIILRNFLESQGILCMLILTPSLHFFSMCAEIERNQSRL